VKVPDALLEVIHDNALRMQRVMETLPDSQEAHELRNALVPILTAVQALRDIARAAPGVAVPRPIRVLIVDDNREAAKALQIGLRLLGYDVDVAYETAQALALVDQRAPAVALVDLGLPGTHGCELATRLRERAPMALFALTGSDADDDRARARDAGFEQYLLKPVDLAVLHRAILSAAGGAVEPGHSR
jgi:CheY-like chemotaxis protein